MAAHSSILAWEIPWTEEPGGLQSMGLQRSDMTEQARTQPWTQKFPFQELFYQVNSYKDLTFIQLFSIIKLQMKSYSTWLPSRPY